MDRLFRLSGAVKRDPDVDAWLDERPGPLGDLARDWFSRMRACGGDVLELIHDGCPVACVADVPFAYVNVFTSHMNVGFFLGAELMDPANLLEGTGKRMRHIKLRPGAELDVVAISDLLAAAYLDVKARLADE